MRLLLLLLLLLWPISVHALVIETNEWDTGSLTRAHWESNGAPTLDSTTNTPSGGNALKITCLAGTFSTGHSCGRIKFKISEVGTYTELYMGHWMKWSSNWVWHPNGTKIDYMFMRDAANVDGNRDNWLSMISRANGDHLIFTQQLWNAPGTQNRNDNVASFIPQLNVWYWIEYHVILNTVGQANGFLEISVNDVLRTQHSNVTYRTTTTPIGYFEHSLEYGGGGTAVIPANQFQWHDHTVISTTRIGMPGGTPPPVDTTPPGIPQNPAATVSGSTGSLSWSAVVDNVGGSGLASYTPFYCIGVGCVPTISLGTVNQPTTSFSHTGLAASTVYGYCYKANDLAGNASGCSGTVYFTTPAAAVLYFTPIFSDTFNRADGVLGPNWTGAFTGRNSYAIVSNQVRVDAVGADSLMVYNGTTANDQYNQIQLVAVGGAGTRAPGLVVRIQDGPAQNGYECRPILPSTSRIAEFLNGSGTTLVTNNDAPWTWQAGDIPECQAEGINLRMYANRAGVKTLLAHTTDGTYTSGKTGIIHFVQNTGGNTTSTIQLDNYVYGTISATPPVPPTLTGLTANPTTATVTHGPVTATQIRVHYGDNAGSFSSNTIQPISAFPGGVYTNTWPNGTQFLRMVPFDLAGVENASSSISINMSSIVDALDTDPVVFGDVQPVGPRPAGTTSVTVSVEIDKPAGCRMDETDRDYDAMDVTGTAVDMSVINLLASAPLSGLTNGSSTTRYIACQFTNSSEGKYNSPIRQAITVTVANSTVDVTAPGAPTNLVAQAIPESTDVFLSWTAPADLDIAFYRVYIAQGACSTYQLSGNPVLITNTQRALTALTGYCFKIETVDTSGNPSLLSDMQTATTFSIPDREPPSIMTGLRISTDSFTKSGQFSWDTCTDAQGPCLTQLEYCATLACTNFAALGPRVAISQSVRDLTPGTFYRVRGIHFDLANNPSGGLDTPTYFCCVEFTTAATGLPNARTEGPNIDRPTGTRPATTRTSPAR